MSGDKQPTTPVDANPQQPTEAEAKQIPYEAQPTEPSATTNPEDPTLPPPETLDQQHTDIIDSAESVDETIDSLPLHQKAAAITRVTKPLQIVKPPHVRTAAITVKREHKETIEYLVKNSGLQISADFDGNNDDELVTITFIVPFNAHVTQTIEGEEEEISYPYQNPLTHGITNIHTLIGELEAFSIPAKMAVAETSSELLHSKGSHLIPLNTNLQEITVKKFRENPDTLETFTVKSSGEASELKKVETRDQIEKFDTSTLSPHEIKYAKSLELKRPQEGECRYMMVDLSTVKDPKEKRKLVEEFEKLQESPDFHITSQGPYLTIIGDVTAERSGSSLTAMATRLWKNLRTLKIFLGAGNLTYDPKDKTKFSITGSPKTTHKSEWEKDPSGIYLSQEFAAILKDKKKRDASLCEIKTRDVPNHPDTLRLASFKSKVSLVIGGPDRLIGYDTEFEELKSAITDEENKLIVLKGPAGIGKSRLVAEALSETDISTPPSYIVCSLDPACKAVPYSGLTLIAEQLIEKVKAEANQADPEVREITKELIGFYEKSQKEKLESTQAHPKLTELYCAKALRLLNKGKTPLLIDDLHHIDRASIQSLTNIIKLYQSEGGKVILSTREEEMHMPEQIKTLIEETSTQHGKSSVKQIELKGLDFGNEKIAKDYIFYSLPKSIRGENDENQLGDWWKELAVAAEDLPLAMTTFIDEILEDENNLKVEAGIIVLKNEELRRNIGTIRGKSDLGKYYKKRINELPQREKTFLQCIALMEGSKPSETQIRTVGASLGHQPAEIDEILATMTKGRYLIESETKKGKFFKLRHESIRGFITETIETPEEKASLSQLLYGTFKDDESLHNDSKFAIAHNIASHTTPPFADDPFWEEYSTLAEACLAESSEKMQHERKYDIAKTILSAEKDVTPIRKILNQTGENPEKIKQKIQTAYQATDQNTRNLLRIALFALAESSVLVGQFEDTQNAVNLLEMLSDIELREMGMLDTSLDLANKGYLQLFAQAYIQEDVAKMEEIYATKLQNRLILSPKNRAIARIKLAFRNRNYQEVYKIFEEEKEFCGLENLESKDPEVIEIYRLAKVRCPFTEAKNGLKTRIIGGFPKKIDEDVILQPGALFSQLPSVLAMLDTEGNLKKLEALHEENPLFFNPYAELSLIEMRAQIEALFGRPESAITKFGEAWRQASQMGIHRQATIMAKMEGDVLITTAIAQITQPQNPANEKTQKKDPIDTEKVKKAIEVYTKQGLASASLIDKKDQYQATIRGQRIRAIGILCEAYKKKIQQAKTSKQQAHLVPQLQETLKEELQAYISDAQDDFIFVDSYYKEKGKDQEEASYYAVSYMGHVLDAAAEFGITIRDEISREPLTLTAEAGEEYATTQFDNEIGEIDRKKSGFASFRIHRRLQKHKD